MKYLDTLPLRHSPMSMDEAFTVALNLSWHAHQGQVDKAGQPYIYHVYRVASAVGSSKEAQTTALLHDVLEDTNVVVWDLVAVGFHSHITEAVLVLTRVAPYDWESYINEVALNELATIVKLADLADNMNLARLPTPTLKDYERYGRYMWATHRLTAASIEHVQRLTQQGG